jgi:hypothetical protein
MTTQDIYFWIQLGVQLLVGGGIVWGICWYIGVLKRAIEGQEKTIAAQAEQMKAQSTVLQDFERLSKLMQQVIDTVDAPAMLERWQKYKEMVEVERQQLTAQLRQEADKDVSRINNLARDAIGSFYVFISRTMRFIAPDQRITLIDESDLAPSFKCGLKKLAEEAPYLPSGNVTTRVLTVDEYIAFHTRPHDS